MDQLRLAVLVFLGHLCVFYVMGYVLLRLFRVKNIQLGDTLLSGYFGYFLLFEVMCVPAQLKGVTTTRLGQCIVLLMAVLLGAVLIAAVIQHKKGQKGCCPAQGGALSLKAIWEEHGFMLIILAGVIVYQIIAVVLSTSNSTDAAYYVAESSVSAFTNRLGRYDVDNSQRLKRFYLRYVYSAFPMHNAVAARLSGLAAIIQAKTVMPAINVIIANLIYYRIGLVLFKEKDKQYTDMFVCFIFMINQLAGTLFLPGTFFFTRLYEGKGMIANLVLPMVLCCGLRLWNDAQDRSAWMWLFFSGGAGMCFAGSGILALFLEAVVLLPVILHHRRVKLLIGSFLSMLPIMIWCMVYAATKLGYISLKIRW